jgi:hypothetical protein
MRVTNGNVQSRLSEILEWYADDVGFQRILPSDPSASPLFWIMVIFGIANRKKVWLHLIMYILLFLFAVYTECYWAAVVKPRGMHIERNHSGQVHILPTKKNVSAFRYPVHCQPRDQICLKVTTAMHRLLLFAFIQFS